MNTTGYSYPFWFINVLFIGYILLSILLYYQEKTGKKIVLPVMCSCMFVLAHLFQKVVVYLPWGLGQCLVCIPFMACGYYLRPWISKAIKEKLICTVGTLFSGALFVIFMIYTYSNPTFSFNIKAMMLPGGVIIDILVPVVLSAFIIFISFFLQKNEKVSTALSYVGNASMTIMFSHASFLYVLQPLISGWCKAPYIAGTVVTCTVLIMSLLSHIFLKKFNITSKLFLGKNVRSHNHHPHL